MRIKITPPSGTSVTLASASKKAMKAKASFKRRCKKTMRTTLSSSSSSSSGEETDDIEGVRSRDEDDQGEDKWKVEKIVDKRIQDGKVMFFVKWKYWPEYSNTWEPIENLHGCRRAIIKYEESQLKTEPDSNGSEGLQHCLNMINNGFAFKCIRGASQLHKDLGSSIHYTLGWEGTDETSLVPASWVNEKYPQEVIKYLSSKVRWVSTPRPCDEFYKGVHQKVVDKQECNGAEIDHGVGSSTTVLHKIKSESEMQED